MKIAFVFIAEACQAGPADHARGDIGRSAALVCERIARARAAP